MFRFGSGLILGIILATVGVNGIVKLSDNVLDDVQDRTRKATYPEQVVDNGNQSREVRPSISYDDDYARQRYGYEPSQR
jgi:hypothetical protein